MSSLGIIRNKWEQMKQLFEARKTFFLGNLA